MEGDEDVASDPKETSMDRQGMPTETVDTELAEAIADRLIASGAAEALAGAEVGVSAPKVDAIAERMLASGLITPDTE